MLGGEAGWEEEDSGIPLLLYFLALVDFFSSPLSCRRDLYSSLTVARLSPLQSFQFNIRISVANFSLLASSCCRGSECHRGTGEGERRN